MYVAVEPHLPHQMQLGSKTEVKFRIFDPVKSEKGRATCLSAIFN